MRSKNFEKNKIKWNKIFRTLKKVFFLISNIPLGSSEEIDKVKLIQTSQSIPEETEPITRKMQKIISYFFIFLLVNFR